MDHFFAINVELDMSLPTDWRTDRPRPLITAFLTVGKHPVTLRLCDQQGIEPRIDNGAAPAVSLKRTESLCEPESTSHS